MQMFITGLLHVIYPINISGKTNLIGKSELITD